jgi:hypothetical protein
MSALEIRRIGREAPQWAQSGRPKVADSCLSAFGWEMQQSGRLSSYVRVVGDWPTWDVLVTFAQKGAALEAE